jgi:hypothetical protein
MSAPPASPPCAPPRWLTFVVLVAAVAAFLPSLAGGFLADDFVYVARFHGLPWSEWPRLFTHDWSGGVWGQPLRELRPFAALSFMGDARWFGGHALGYRLTNLALHLLATALVVRLAWRYSAGNIAAGLAAGLTFALHPCNAEAVAWITGRVDLQATVAALLFWLGAEIFVTCGGAARLALALTAFFLGVFSKELCLFAPLLLLLIWVLLTPGVSRREWLRRGAVLLGAVVVLAAYAVCRRLAFGHDSIGYNLWTDEPAWHRQASYAGWLVPVLPFMGAAEWRSFPSLAMLHALWLGIAVVVVLGLALARWRGIRWLAAACVFGGIWYFATVFPLTGVVYFSPRHLYFPSVGLALAVGFVCTALRWRSIGIAALIVWLAAAHIAALRPWQKAAAVSREALTALDRELASAGPGAVALTAVPETLGPVWLWAWSSPQCVSAPFLQHPPDGVVERPVNYARSDRWAEERHPVQTVHAAPEAVVLYVDGDGRIACRRVSRAELLAAADRLPAAGTGLSAETWTDWVRSLAAP